MLTNITVELVRNLTSILSNADVIAERPSIPVPPDDLNLAPQVGLITLAVTSALCMGAGLFWVFRYCRRHSNQNYIRLDSSSALSDYNQVNQVKMEAGQLGGGQGVDDTKNPLYQTVMTFSPISSAKKPH